MLFCFMEEELSIEIYLIITTCVVEDDYLFWKVFVSLAIVIGDFVEEVGHFVKFVFSLTTVVSFCQ